MTSFWHLLVRHIGVIEEGWSLGINVFYCNLESENNSSLGNLKIGGKICTKVLVDNAIRSCKVCKDVEYEKMLVLTAIVLVFEVWCEVNIFCSPKGCLWLFLHVPYLKLKKSKVWVTWIEYNPLRRVKSNEMEHKIRQSSKWERGRSVQIYRQEGVQAWAFEVELPVVIDSNHVHLLFKLFNLIVIAITGIRYGTWRGVVNSILFHDPSLPRSQNHLNRHLPRLTNIFCSQRKYYQCATSTTRYSTYPILQDFISLQTYQPQTGNSTAISTAITHGRKLQTARTPSQGGI